MDEYTQLPSATPRRAVSIDALRGFDMFCITGGERVFRAILRLIPNSHIRALTRQFSHVPWEGFHFHDLIFPLFLFVVGAVLPFSLARRAESGAKRSGLYRHIVRRLVLLFVLGLVYNGLLDFQFHNLRIPGVLQRIAICYFVAALLVMNLSIRGQAAVAGGILVVYWAVMRLIPVAGIGAGIITPQANLAGYIDRLLIPRPYCCYQFGDNEGLLSTFPAIATTLLGVLAGHWLRSRQTPQRKVLGLAGAGVLSLLVGGVWSHWFPIIKNIWTSSYVLWAGGWSLLLLALFYWIIDVRGYKRWSFFFVVVGMNPITIYLAWHLFDFGTVTRIFVGGFINYCGPLRPLVWEFAVMMTGWLFLWFLHRQKIYLRV